MGTETNADVPCDTAVLDQYLSQLFRKVHVGDTLTDAFVQVLSMQQPPSSLLPPGVAWRVLRPGRLDERSPDEPREHGRDRSARAHRR